jgi:hypothetical protein
MLDKLVVGDILLLLLALLHAQRCSNSETKICILKTRCQQENLIQIQEAK